MNIFRRTSIIIMMVLLCLTTQLIAEGTPGLAFARITGQNAYEVRRGTADASHIIIPANNPNTTTGWPVTRIANQGFEGFNQMTNVSIPNSVTTIGSGAFGGCWGLKSVTIPNSVTTIGDEAFIFCIGMISIIIPNSVTTIGDHAFVECPNLTIFAEPLSQPSGWHHSWNIDWRPVVWGFIPNITNFQFTLINNNTAYAVSRGNTTATEVVIPAEHNGLPVTAIANSGFRDFTIMTDVTIPNSVTSIGDLAFFGCAGLTSITISNSVTTIGQEAFSGCTGLTCVTFDTNAVINFNDIFLNTPNISTVTLGNNVHFIHAQMFLNRTNLTTVTIGNSVTIIGFQAFRGTGLTSISIPNSVTTIGQEAFMGCSGLISVTFESPSMVTRIERDTFRGCTGLTIITIPNSVTTIGQEAFSGCTGLTSVTIPNSVTFIGNNAFSGCTGLVSVIFDSNALDGLNERTFARIFSNTPNISTVILGDNVQNIHAQMFLNRTNLTTVTIGNSVTTIGQEAFRGSGLTTISIPNSVTSIGAGAFRNCMSLTNITIPNGVTIIDQNTFQNCTSLTSITIPNSVTTIGQEAFSGSGLTSITIPNSVTTIGQEAFSGSGLTTIAFPNSVTSIGDDAFRDCTGLRSVTIPNSVTSIGHNVFFGCFGLRSVSFDTNVFVAGHSNVNGSFLNVFRSSHINDITIGDNVTSIHDYMFYDMRSLVTVTIGNGVTTIGHGAFAYCVNLVSVTIPNSVTSIGSVAFWNCWSLTNITIPNSVTSIWGEAFQGCSILTIFAEPSLRPVGWNSHWNPNNRPVAWGYIPGTNVGVFSPRNDFIIESTQDLHWAYVLDDLYNEYQLIVSTNQNLSNPIINQTVSSDVTSFEFTSQSQAQSRYYWQVRPVGSTTNSPTWVFTSLAPNNTIVRGRDVMAESPFQPVAPTFSFSYVQNIFYPSDMSTAAGNNITSIGWYYFGDSAWTDQIRIYMAHTTVSTFSDINAWIKPTDTDWTRVFQGNLAVPNTPGMVFVNLDTPFNYNFSSNLLIAIESYGGVIGSGGFVNFGHIDGRNKTIHAHSSDRPFDIAYPASGNLSTEFAMTVLTFAPAPSPVTLLLPENNAMGVSRMPIFTWQQEEGATPTHYRITVSRNADLSGHVVQQDIDHPTTTFTLNELLLEPNAVYYWSVVPFDQAGSPQSNSVSAFTTMPLVSNVTLVSPTQNQQNVSVTPTFSWQTGEGGTPTEYRLVVSRNFDLTNPAINVAVNHPTTYYTPTIKLEGTTLYFWSVTPSNKYDEPTDATVQNFRTEEYTETNDETVLPVVTELLGNFPNPFNPATSIRYQVSGIGDQFVQIGVYNIRGQRVRNLVNEYMIPGEHYIVWNGRDDNGVQVGSGVYFYRMQAGEFIETRRMVLMK